MVKHNSENDDYTDFGFKRIPKSEKNNQVASVFRSVAGKYDVMNDVMSLGIHRLWKRYALELASIRPGQMILDLAGGTGDLAMKMSQDVGEQGQVILADINEAMLQHGRDRLINKGIVGNIQFVQANAECLPFPENSFDLITIAFGLRNVTNKNLALQSMFRALKPGGKLLILEFSKPTLPGLSYVYDLYSFHVLPRLGKFIANDADSYRYLAESIRKHPDQKTLQQMMENEGFSNCDYHNLTGGIVALHRGYKI